MLGAQPGAVREDRPGVYVESGVRERRRGLAVGVPGCPVARRVRTQVMARPARRVRRVEDGGVFGGDDAMARMTGVRARVEW